MDFDIEMGDAPDEYGLEEPIVKDILPVEDAQEPGEVDESPSADDVAPDEQHQVLNKVHMRGLDTLNPDDIKTYVKEQFSAGAVERIEWIDDSSANLVFASDSTAAEALISLCAVQISDATQLPPLELLPAKSYAPKPDAVLQVRFAVVGDRKQQGAAARSRFYLLNPEFDPEERRRRGEFNNNRRYRDRNGGRDGRDGYRRGGRRWDERRDEEEEKPFDVNLYDDDEESLAKRAPRRRGSRSRSRSSGSGSERERNARRAGNRDKELFPDHAPSRGRSGRNRSASPARSPGGDLRADDAAVRNRDTARSIKDRISRDLRGRDRDSGRGGNNGTKELFPSRDNSAKELFASSRDNSTKELFPSKTAAGGVGKAQMDQVDGVGTVTRQLSDRVTRPSSDGGGFSIRGGASRISTDQGFAIKGAAASARELFPEKLNNNAGKELFADKPEARKPRQRAQDLFY